MTALDEAVERLVDITTGIEAHRRCERYDAEQLLDQIEDQVREIRHHIEALADQPG